VPLPALARALLLLPAKDDQPHLPFHYYQLELLLDARLALRRNPQRSASCPCKPDNLKTTATLKDMLGGNPMISCKVGEKLNGQFIFTYKKLNWSGRLTPRTVQT
jgi:hypothetical protein